MNKNTVADNKLFSVIIPTYHRNDMLEKCLDCLHPDAQTIQTDQYEVIVSDDGRETTAQALVEEKYPWVQWVKGPQRGPAANRNNGAKVALGEWLVFTDDDCLPMPDWLNAYIELVANTTVKVVEGKTIADRLQRRYDEESPINETGGNLWSCNFAIQAKLFRDIGQFDEEFPYPAMEDVDLLIRLKEKGVKTLFLTNAVIIHPYRQIEKDKFGGVLWSFRYLLIKHNQINIEYRIGRVKYLLKSIFINGGRLVTFNFRGWLFYVREHVFLFKLIFVSTNKNSNESRRSN
ncbi:glycosyltransferase family 2 protein [Spirosoma rigui]|uniref:glycosyltransferase family 2 protein n=1 Tax=Spirosoma rigui TaxID=564064 RepID=UPI0009B0510B|nr:glycosyltransferase [Spirosoma rigui]